MTNFGGFGPPGGQNAPPPTLQTCGSVVTRTKPAIYKKIIFKENVLIISSGALGLLQGRDTDELCSPNVTDSFVVICR